MGLRAVVLVYLGLLIALPMWSILSKGFSGGLTSLRDALSAPGAMNAMKLTLVTAVICTVVNAIFGTLIAYVLVRVKFPGRSIMGTLIDLPFAIPTLVTGVMLVALYGPASPVGRWFKGAGIPIIFQPIGIVLALLFVTLPFVIRTVQPVLHELDVAEEEAATVLGAPGWTTFRRVVFPAIRPAVVAGSLLSFARALGEFGAIVIVSGNLTGKTLTAPVFIFQLTSQFRYEEAAAVSGVLFLLSFSLVLITSKLLGHKEHAL
jgi:sulfate transport system permease protein